MDIGLEGSGAAAWKFLAHRLKQSDKHFGEILRYWDSLRDGDTLPARADLDPRVIQGSLPNAFILDRTRPGTIRMRVAGGHLNALMGMEVRGMPVRAFFDLMERRRLMELVEQVFTGHCLLELDLASETQMGAPLLGKMLILPMRDHAGEVTKALGCLVTNGEIGQTPRRFRIRREIVTPVVANQPVPSITRTLPGLAEPKRPYHPAPATPPTKEALTTTPAPISPELEEASEPGPVPWLRIVR